MRRTSALTSAAIALVLALGGASACSSDGDGGGGDSLQQQVADQTVEQMSGDDVTVDDGCVQEKADQLSDEDAQAILDTDLGGDADVSDEAKEIAASLVECISVTTE